MKFKNEMTWLRYQRRGRAEAFHLYYESAVSKVKSSLGSEYPAYIGGEEVKAPEKFVKTSPIDYRMKLAYVQLCTEEHVKHAIEEAERAFESWSSIPYKRRASVFLKAADIMSKLKFELAALQTLENGKNRYEAIADIDEAIDYLRFQKEDEIGLPWREGI